LPNTLEDVWVRAAEGEMEKAARLIHAYRGVSHSLYATPGR